MRLSKQKKAIFTAVLLSCSILTALFVCELALRYHQEDVQKSDFLDPGMIIYDRKLGWKLSPQWQGNHLHHDFKARYRINRQGYRGKLKGAGDHRRRFAFLGDSFTFGMGVNEQETFVARLNQTVPQSLFFNFAVPGFSTDQQYLLLRQKIFDFRPDVVFLVTYLGNDLFDNMLPFPLQAHHGKPYFEFFEGRLILKNTPVPRAPKSKKQSELDLHRVVMGDTLLENGWLLRHLEKSALFQMLRNAFSSDRRDLFPLFDERFQRALEVYGALLKEMDAFCHENGAELILVLMPGRSLVERSGSQSAQFQEYLLEKIIEKCRELHIPFLDLAQRLKTVYTEMGKRLFYPNEGHLNPLGHQITADYMQAFLKEERIQE